MCQRIPAGFQLIDPLEHCSQCGNKFTQAELNEYRDEVGYMLSLGPDSPFRPLDHSQADDFPEICIDCAELQERVERAERAAGWDASP